MTCVTAIYQGGVLRLLDPVSLEEGQQVQVLLLPSQPTARDEPGATTTVDERPHRSPAEILAEIAKKSVRYGREETASRDHDQILYGDDGAR